VPFESLGTVSYSTSIVTGRICIAVCEIFSVKEWCDLEKMVRVPSRSLEMAPFDRSHTSSYSPSIVTIWRYFVSFARYSDLLVENREIFYTPPVFSAPARGDPVGILWKCLMPVKLEWLGYRTVKKLWRYVKPFSSDTGTLRTDRQTDRFAISISRVSMLTRGKKDYSTFCTVEANYWQIRSIARPLCDIRATCSTSYYLPCIRRPR